MFGDKSHLLNEHVFYEYIYDIMSNTSSVGLLLDHALQIVAIKQNWLEKNDATRATLCK